MRIIFFDMEATGLWSENGHRLVEIAAIESINGHLTNTFFHSYLNPQRTMEDHIIDIHGLTNSFLSDKPLFQDIAHDFRDFVGNSQIYITCRIAPDGRAADISMTNYELQSNGIFQIPLCQWTNIRPWGEKLFGYEQASLDKMLDHYGIDRSERNEYHGALKDARLLATLFPFLKRDYSKLISTPNLTI